MIRDEKIYMTIEDEALNCLQEVTVKLEEIMALLNGKGMTRAMAAATIVDAAMDIWGADLDEIGEKDEPY